MTPGDDASERPASSVRDVLSPPSSCEIPGHRVLRARIDDVRRGRELPDWAFDRIYPERVRAASERYWTPLRVARRAAEMLAPDASTRVLDVGSGAGKFCLVAALTAPGQYTGVEQRGHLVEVASAIAERYDVPRATYLHGDMRDIDWAEFDAFYFFNPFSENYFEASERLDHSVELSPDRFHRDMQYVRAVLAGMEPGARVITYHGLGSALPGCFKHLASQEIGTDSLELWLKAEP